MFLKCKHSRKKPVNNSSYYTFAAINSYLYTDTQKSEIQKSKYIHCCCSVTKSYVTLILWTAAHQASLSFTISWSLLKLMSIESIPHILCCPLLLLPSIFPSIREWAGSSHQVASATVLPTNIPGWYTLGWTSLISLLYKGLSRVFSSTTIWKHQIFINAS